MVQCLRLCLPLQKLWVQSLVRKLRSRMPHSAGKTNKQKHLIARTVLKKIFKKMLKKTVKEENRKDLFSFL